MSYLPYLNVKLEDYPRGYARFAAFLSLDENFTVVKRFDYLHMRNILDQQDQLAELEEKLLQTDNEEKVQLSLSSRRQDDNRERRALMSEIKARLKEYDDALRGFSGVLRLPEAQERQRKSIYHWFQANKPLVRSESRTYDQCLEDDDYIALASKETDRATLETIFDIIIQAFPRVSRYFNISESKTRDSSIVIFPTSFLARCTKVFLAIFIPLWLISPTLLLYNVFSHTSRMVVFALFTMLTSLIVVASTNVTKSDLILALVTYTAMLGAFLASETS